MNDHDAAMIHILDNVKSRYDQGKKARPAEMAEIEAKAWEDHQSANDRRAARMAALDADFSFLSDHASPSEVQLRSLCWDTAGARAYHPGPNGGETDLCRDSSLGGH